MKCCRCKQKINQERDRWVNVKDFDSGKLMGEKNVHLTCWKNMIKNDIGKVLREKVNQVMKMVGGVKQ